MKHKLTLLLLLSLFIFGASQAQNTKQKKKITLTGFVVDGEQNPIANASVFIDGKNTNKKSDAEGRFIIKIKPTVKKITVFALFNELLNILIKAKKKLRLH